MYARFAELDYAISNVTLSQPPYRENLDPLAKQYVQAIRKYADDLGDNEVKNRLAEKAAEVAPFCLPSTDVLGREREKRYRSQPGGALLASTRIELVAPTASQDREGAASRDRHLAESKTEADDRAENRADVSQRKRADHAANEHEGDELSGRPDLAAISRSRAPSRGKECHHDYVGGWHAPVEDHARKESKRDERKHGHDDCCVDWPDPFHRVLIDFRCVSLD
jgi:hypothetical protein